MLNTNAAAARTWFSLQILIAASVLSAAAAAESVSVFSPDKRIEVRVKADTALSYSVWVDRKPVLLDSSLGFDLGALGSFGPEVQLVKSERRSHDAQWENRWGKRRQVRDHYNELQIVLRPGTASGKTFEVLFRAYNDGAAFRYLLPAANGAAETILTAERTQFRFPADFTCFAGHQEGGFQGAQEWEFKRSKLSEIKPEAIVGLPLLIQTPAAWVALLESDLRDWAGLWLGGVKDSQPEITLQAKLAPRKDGPGLVKVTKRLTSPWRVLIIGREPGRLLESDLVLNLATPCQLTDTSWVKPGKMAWDHWWSGDVQMDTSTLKQYIQLAADMGWPYQLIDWQWYGEFNKPASDITKVNPAVDMQEVRRFAAEKGVKLWVWLYWTDVERGEAYLKAFALYEQWGMVGIKIDFMDRDDQEIVNWYEKITKAAAAHHLMVNFHGAFKTSGFNRTYPNQVTREGILGNEYNRWSTRVTPEHKLTLPFTRFLAGPADFTPGGFLNRQPNQFKPDGKQATVQGTRAAELALLVAFDSPLCCVCDHPDHYRNQPGADFLKIVPTVWDDTRVLDAEVGRHLVLVRRSGDRWFLGGMTDNNAREVTIQLDFLKRGRWKAQLWNDAPDSDSNAEHLAMETREVRAGETLKLHFAPAGGCAAVFTKQ